MKLSLLWAGLIIFLLVLFYNKTEAKECVKDINKNDKACTNKPKKEPVKQPSFEEALRKHIEKQRK